MAVPLSRPYACRYGAPVLDRVDPKIFTLTYFMNCMECGFCHDSCCQYGADIELPRMRALEALRGELEPYLGLERARWFRDGDGEDDLGIIDEPEYPGGAYSRTAVAPLPSGRSPHNTEACVFLDPVGRGCRIHRFAIERNIDVHDIKPMVCLFFPLCHGEGELRPAIEFELNDLICQGPGPTLYEASREEVLYYFGAEMVSELDRIASEYTGPPEKSNRIALPVSPSIADNGNSPAVT